ncbi:uncharacterized protein LOC131851867 [Achroia grisella]|uniref:uncharacterized protein LOC131851867 n=1 Tax=Achroia grisella TaxID=688607 RepID=UPI0027D2C1B0|nr:uncharacterized protein LOC131851867 [Achroia grisella]
MRALLLLALVTVCCAAPQFSRSSLQVGDNDSDGQPFIEEVVVESTLHVKNPLTERQARTNTKTNLQDGTRVAESKQ